MGSLENNNFSTQADEVMTPNNAKVEMVNVGGQNVMEISAKPGWKWSTDTKPVVGTESCQSKPVSVIVEGSITCRHDDGSEMTDNARSAYSIEPSHDAWVNGDTAAVAYELHGLWSGKG